MNALNLSNISLKLPIESYLDEIVNLYIIEKKTVIQISEIYHTSQYIIRKLLKGFGIKLRQGKSYLNRKYKLNEEYFREINSANKAYLLGLLFADGCVAHESNTVSLVSNDIELITFFKNEIVCDKAIYRNPSHQNAFTYSFCSPNMKSDLINLGCVPRKSKIIKFPCLLDSIFYRDFLRGNFDGDGSINISKNGLYQAYFLGTFSFCDSVKQIMESIKIKTNKIQENVGVFRLRITNRDGLKKLYNFLYNGNFYLSRKKRIFDEVIAKIN